MATMWNELKRRNVVRVAIAYAVVSWFFLQLTDVLSSLLSLPETLGKTVFVILVVGFPVALFCAWVYELTPDGLKKEQEVDRSKSIARETGRRIDFLIIGVLIVAVGVLLVDKMFLSDMNADAQSVADVSDAPSIAVLPFANMSADPNSTYFSDGLADTLLNMLGQVSDLHVAARTSSFQFRDQSMDVAVIGAQLKVENILEGSVQIVGEKIRITAQLVDVDSGYHLWSANYDRELDDVFRIQDEIATEVVAALKLSLMDPAQQPIHFEQTDSVAAYAEFLLALDAIKWRSTQSLGKALGHLQEAIRIDPYYAEAHASLGLTLLIQEDFGMLSPAESQPLAEDAADRALSLSPSLPIAMAVLAEVERRRGNLDIADGLYEEALSLAPNDTRILYYYAEYLENDKLRLDDANDVRRKIVALDPLNEEIYIAIGWTLMYQRRYDEVRAVLADLYAINPDNQVALSLEAYLEQYSGNLAAAIRLYKRSFEIDPGDPEVPSWIGRLYLAVDMPEEARRWFDRSIEIDPEQPLSIVGPLLLDYYLQTDPVATFNKANEILRNGLENRLVARSYAMTILADLAPTAGQTQIALQTMDQLYPGVVSDFPDPKRHSSLAITLVAWLLQQDGQTQKAAIYIESLENRTETVSSITLPVSIVSVWNEVILGELANAVELVDRFEQDMYYQSLNGVWFTNHHIFDPLRDETAFQALQKTFQDNAAEQRQLLQTKSNSPAD